MKRASITGVMLSLATAVMPAVAQAAPTPEELAMHKEWIDRVAVCWSYIRGAQVCG